MIPEKYRSVECVPQTELQDLHAILYVSNRAAANSALRFPKIFRKSKLDHLLGYFLAYSIVVGVSASFSPWNNG